MNCYPSQILFCTVFRIYYHSRSCLPMLPKELEAESEEQLQTLEWQNICSQKVRQRWKGEEEDTSEDIVPVFVW